MLFWFGLGIGLLGGFFGSGGGILAVALLQKQGLEPRRAHATSIAIILPLSLISLIVYWLNGNLPLTQSLPFFVPALLGSAAGAALLKKIPVQLLKLVFAGLILYSGICLLMALVLFLLLLCKLRPQHLLGRLDLVGQGVLGQLGEQFDFGVEDRPHTVGDVLLMRPVNRHTLLAVAVIAAGLLAGAVVLVLVLLAELRRKFLLQPQPLRAVALVELLHRRKLFWVLFNLHDFFLLVVSAPIIARCSFFFHPD